MLAIFWPVVAWLLRQVIIKFVIFSALFAVVAFFVPYVINLVQPFIGIGNLNIAFGNIGPGIWWWLDTFNVALGLPLIIIAYVCRFLIRRLPVIG